MVLPRSAALLVVLALTAVACIDDPTPTTPEDTLPESAPPAPAAGIRVGVVLPAGDPSEDRELGYLQTDLRGLAATLPDGVAELRTVVPDDGSFVPDLAQLLVQRGTDLVCVIGAEGRRVVADLVDVHPERRYCALPASGTSHPDGVTLIDVRIEEIGHAVGVAALAHAGSDARIGVVMGSDRVGRDRFLAGLEAAVGEDRLLEHGPDGPEEAEEAVREVLDAEVAVVVVDVGAGTGEILELAAEAAAVISPISTLTAGPVSDATIVSWRVRWDVILRPVLARLVNADLEVPESVGFAEDALSLTPGPAAGLRVRAALDAVLEEFRQATRDPLEPVAPEVEDDEPDEPENEASPDEPADAGESPDPEDATES